MADLHPGVAVLAPLLGTWSGTGHGQYPTIEPFDYGEDVTFGHTGKPFLTYTQRTKASADGRPLHAETGYLRVPSPGRIEFVIVQPTGVTEVDEGVLSVDGSGLGIDAESTSIGLTGSAKEVTAVTRSIRVAGDELSYTLLMGAVGVPLVKHLSATLHRQP
ncbi:UPF0678 fatty acid-binding protein-like protein [Mycolicibacterium anyangense]|uniref:Peroxynitrite isomerase n=1 Tax=Mycolicibacterium anyangense TaxID=1431246 RepID=A0A6N4WEP0_9MYCO|nr:FABP family protein [Mycolicibacterium anyangense]BBZ78412.1 UPF0678 fatty acid-binding protein-like protein [Mycolicibacterium anyangense]